MMLLLQNLLGFLDDFVEFYSDLALNIHCYFSLVCIFVLAVGYGFDSCDLNMPMSASLPAISNCHGDNLQL